MSKVIISICSRKEKESLCLDSIRGYAKSCPPTMDLRVKVAYDAPSIYEGHKSNILPESPNDNDIIVMCHDDIEILSHHEHFYHFLQLALKRGVGFIGVAGATLFDTNGAWWHSRNVGAARGFVYQGKDNVFRTPNYFGPQGQVAVLDGCFLACSYATLKSVGIEKPTYLTSDWDFYDIHMTSRAHFMGYSNFTVPIIIRHESNGEMRQGWYTSRNEFMKYHGRNVPITLPYSKTHGLPS